MLNSKFNLYNTEWLDVVFYDRNKAYGAYELRRSYDNTMSRAMATAFLGIGLIAATVFVIHKLQPPEPVVKITTVIDNYHPHLIIPKKAESVKPQTPPPLKQQPTKKLVEFTVTEHPVTEAPPKEIDLRNSAISSVSNNVPGTGTATNIDPAKSGSGTGGVEVTTTVDNTVYPPIGLESLPHPIGGDQAWAKFLQKNLRYPAEAQDKGVSGRSLISFIIERNGEISNIEIVRPGGYGFDEEAARVLKMAKAWKPGVQNGQAVRVKFTIPINFTLTEQ